MELYFAPVPDDVGKSKPATVFKSIIKTRLDKDERWDEMRDSYSKWASTCRYTLFLLLAILTAKRLRLPFPGDTLAMVMFSADTTLQHTSWLKLVPHTVDRYYLLLLYRINLLWLKSPWKNRHKNANILCTQPHASLLLATLHTRHTYIYQAQRTLQ